jgi:hypothetical protein
LARLFLDKSFLFIMKTNFPVAEHGTCFVNAVFGLNLSALQFPVSAKVVKSRFSSGEHAHVGHTGFRRPAEKPIRQDADPDTIKNRPPRFACFSALSRAR